MRSLLRPILFLGFIHLLQAQSDPERTTTESATVTQTKASSRYRDPLLSRIWPNRTSNEERIKALAIALRDADRVLNSKRSRKNDRSEKPRIFASPIMAPELRPPSNDKPAEPLRRNIRLKSRTINGKYSAPSPILLPPYKSYSPEYDFDAEKTVELPFGENFETTEIPNNSTVGRIKIYEITTGSPSTERAITKDQKRPSHGSQVIDRKNNFDYSARSRTDFRNTVTPTDDRIDYQTTTSDQQLDSYPYYNYEDVTTVEPLKIKLNASISLNSFPRGSIKYQQQDLLDSNEIQRRKDAFSSAESAYNWKGPSSQQSFNHYKYSESSRKIGAIPGIAGRDYPVHQQHTHHHLRYPGSRFLCPDSPGTHVYLADRASRCQIFYVCYGEQTGVPMMCPNGTLFSEHLQVCDWWFNVAC